MKTSYSAVALTPHLSVNFRSLTIPEISDIIRHFRNEIGPMVGRAAGLTLERESAHASEDSIKQAMQYSLAILDQVVTVASDLIIDSKAVTTLPLPAKIEALGVVIRRTLEEIPFDRLATSIAITMMTTIGSDVSSQWVQPAQPLNGLN